MTRKHYMYFKFWKFLMRLRGIKYGKVVSIFYEERQIIGIVSGLSGDSINDKLYGFEVNIKWLEPLQGNDPRYHTYGSYEYKELIKNNITW